MIKLLASYNMEVNEIVLDNAPKKNEVHFDIGSKKYSHIFSRSAGDTNSSYVDISISKIFLIISLIEIYC
jgi:hypothetical protein